MRAILVLLASVSLAGCIIVADGKLTDISPSPAAFAPTVEHSVARDFSVHDGGLELEPARAGARRNGSILERWETEGRIRRPEYVEHEAFTGRADYEITLAGSMNQRRSLWTQVVFALTAGLVPSSSHLALDLHYSARERATGRVFEAKASDSVSVTWETFLVFAAPFAHDGIDQTFTRLANHLYQQLYDAGAFRAPAETAGLTRTR